MLDATLIANMWRMRIFEIYPPSSAALSLGAAAGMSFGGLKFAVVFLAGAVVAAAGHWLDRYGVRGRD